MKIQDNLPLRHYVVVFTSDELSRCLINDGVYEKYIDNCVAHMKGALRSSEGLSTKEVFRMYYPCGIIKGLASAFVWGESPEGNDYWSMLWSSYI